MKKFLVFIAVNFLAMGFISAQGVAISDQSSPNVSNGAVLDVSSSSSNAKGFLPPRITSEKKAVTDKTNGLLYYFTNSRSYGYWTPEGWCSFVISGPYSGAGNDTIEETVKFTPLGGLAVKVTNKSGSTLSKGKLVQASAADDNAVVLATGNEAIGVIFEDISNNTDGWIVVAGIAEVLPYTDDTPTRGDIVRISPDHAGNGEFSATSSTDIDAHSREIGYCIKSGSMGSMAKVVLQF